MGKGEVSTRDRLLAEMENIAAWNFVDQHYRARSTVGDGGTAAAVRHERVTGERVGGRSHVQKASEGITRLNTILNEQRLTSNERSILESILKEFMEALYGVL